LGIKRFFLGDTVGAVELESMDHHMGGRNTRGATIGFDFSLFVNIV
jgi:hypothetical protein